MRRRWFTWFLSVLALSTAGCASAPTPDDLIDRSIDASGGREAMERIHNRLLVGTFEVPELQLEGTVQIAMRGGGEFLPEVELPDYRVWEGSTGDQAWELTPVGARTLDGEEGEQAIRSGDLHRLLTLRERFDGFRVRPEPEAWAGRWCHVLEVNPIVGGSPELFYFDRETGLVVGNVVRYPTPDGKEEIRSDLGDHRVVDGVSIAHRVRQWSRRKGNTAIVRYETVRHNIDDPEFEALFALPDLVEALGVKRATPSDSTP